MAQVLRIPNEIYVAHELGLYQYVGTETVPEYVEKIKAGLLHGRDNNADLYDLDEMCAYVDTLVDEPSYLDLIQKVEERLFSGYKSYGDKYPHVFLGEAAAILDTFYFIYMLRDPRDVVLSRKRAMQIPKEIRPGWATDNIHKASYDWLKTLEWYERWMVQSSIPSLSIKLEDLVYKKSTVAGRLGAFLNIPVSDILDSIESKVTVENSNVGAWVEELPEWESEFYYGTIKRMKGYGYI